jgi:hypothetical protein
LEHFNEALHLKIRSETLKKRLREGKQPEKKIVREAMLFKIRDEQCTNKETNTEMQGERRSLKSIHGENTRRTRGIMKTLNGVAQEERAEMHEKYRKKIKTLKLKHLVDIDTKTNIVPAEIKEYEEAKVFSKEEFDNIEEEKIMIVKVGDIEISQEVELVLKKHPKFALLENLKIEDLELDFEIGFGKYRYQMLGEERTERERRKEREETGVGDKDDDLTPEERQEQEINNAKTRQLFDPIDKTYDGRKLRVTDLEINTRVTLPKGLSEEQEAYIEIRRSKYLEVGRKYIGENCNSRGEQRPNLSKNELRGLISLKKRI